MTQDIHTELRRRSIPLDPSQLPTAEAAEAALMDAALCDHDARELALALPVGAMTSPAYQPMLRVMQQMQRDGLPPDRISVREAAKAMGLDADAIWDTMQDIDGASSHSGDAEPHAKVIRERYEQRVVIQRVHATLEHMVQVPDSARRTARALVDSLLDFAGSGDTGYIHAGVAVSEAFKDAELRASGDTSRVVRTGVDELDGDPVGGMDPGDLCSWVMVSGHGKTAAMALVSLRAALLGSGVGFISAEMTAKQIARRWVSLLSGLPFRRLKAWDLSAHEISRAEQARAIIDRLPLFVDDMGTPSLAHVMTQARRLVQRQPSVRLLVVDYITLVQGTSTHQVEAYGQVIRALKRLAKELNVAIVGLVQPDARTIEKREPTQQMPELADIAWSQEFRNQSDLIVTGYRPGESMRQKTGMRLDDTHGSFAVRKSRNGGGGEWTWSWDGETMGYDGGCSGDHAARWTAAHSAPSLAVVR